MRRPFRLPFGVRPFFRWYDLWVGIYIDTNKRALYFIPFPALGCKIWLPMKLECPCGECGQSFPLVVMKCGCENQQDCEGDETYPHTVCSDHDISGELSDQF